jgi:hypothetical protein
MAELRALVARHRVTTLLLYSGIFERLVDDGFDGLQSLRQLLTGGDVMSPRHAEQFLRALPTSVITPDPATRDHLAGGHSIRARIIRSPRPREPFSKKLFERVAVFLVITSGRF